MRARTISRLVTVIIFLALIRTMLEPLRRTMTGEQIRPLIIGSLIAAGGCLIITFLGFYAKHKAIIAMGTLTLIALIVFKNVCMS